MKYKEIENCIKDDGYYIVENDWYISRPMYQLYTKMGILVQNLQYRTVFKAFDNIKFVRHDYYGYRLYIEKSQNTNFNTPMI